MRIGASLGLVIVGAVLRLTASAPDATATTGAALMIAGAVGLMVAGTLLIVGSGDGRRRRAALLPSRTSDGAAL